MVQIKTPEQIAKMREAGLVVAAIHAATREAAVPGATTKDLDEAARKVLAEHNAKPNFLGYGGFPATICTSVNEVVVRSEEHTSELQSRENLVCRLLLEEKKTAS